MLRSIVYGSLRLQSVRGSACALIKKRCVTNFNPDCFQDERVQHIGIDYSDYVVIDFSDRDLDDATCSPENDMDTISPHLEKKPDFVCLERIEERHYWGRVRSLMKGLGYKGYLEDLRRGRGKGIFIRNDVADLVKPYSVAVYSSRRPNPF